MLRIGTDIGGTFTDITMVDQDTGEVAHRKVLTSAQQPAEAVIKSLEQAGVDLKHTGFFSHGTTIAINAVIEGKGARTGIVTTRGFRDVLELRRGARTHILDPLMDKPPCFVPGRWRTEVNERVLADGTVARPLDPEELCAAVGGLVADGVESVALCFLHSYAYPEHERAAAAILTQRFPQLAWTLSSDVVPEIKEFERTSTAALNAYCQPVVERYLDELERDLRARGLETDVYLMQSNGGLMTAQEAGRSPIHILESGPAAGAIAAARLGARMGVEDLITFDMGGTTAKSAVIEAGEPLVTVEFELFEEPDKPGSGWPVRVPMIDIIEIGAGGGSIAWIDEAGRLQVGPRSAGSEPGPVCYGRGGREPTITDAHAVLGNLRTLLGGEFPLDVEAARAAVRRKVAEPLGLDVEEAAAGVLRIGSAKVADLIREVTVARGRDPRLFALVAYGGAGPLEALSVIAELDMPQAVIPLTPGTFSAFGLLDSDVIADAVRTYLTPLDEADPAIVARLCAEMADQLGATLGRQHLTGDRVRVEFRGELRYRGQFHQITIPLADPDGGQALLAALAEAFHGEHVRLYTYESRDEALELVSLRARATGLVIRAEPPPLAAGTTVGARSGERPVRFRDSPSAVATPIYDRARLGAGAVIEGPAVVEEHTSATLIPPGFQARVDKTGNLLLGRLA